MTRSSQGIERALNSFHPSGVAAVTSTQPRVNDTQEPNVYLASATVAICSTLPMLMQRHATLDKNIVVND